MFVEIKIERKAKKAAISINLRTLSRNISADLKAPRTAVKKEIKREIAWVKIIVIPSTYNWTSHNERRISTESLDDSRSEDAEGFSVSILYHQLPSKTVCFEICSFSQMLYIPATDDLIDQATLNQ